MKFAHMTGNVRKINRDKKYINVWLYSLSIGYIYMYIHSCSAQLGRYKIKTRHNGIHNNFVRISKGRCLIRDEAYRMWKFVFPS